MYVFFSYLYLYHSLHSTKPPDEKSIAKPLLTYLVWLVGAAYRMRTSIVPHEQMYDMHLMNKKNVWYKPY